MSLTLPFAGKSIWITGGAGYLGTPITTALDAAGAKVLCLDLHGRAETLVAERRLSRTTGLTFDCSDAAALPPFLEATMAAHGVPDAVAHLAFASSAGKRLEQLLPEEFQRTFDLSLTPAFVLCRALAERMKVRGSGSIVLFASMYGLVSPDPRIYVDQLTPNPIDYGASKAAVLQMARYLAVHYGPSGIRFNCVTPGTFPSPAIQAANPVFLGELKRKTALHRVGRPEEIVGPTLFLLGDASSYVTGHSLVVDGGWTAW
jgi:NAD(P)-dependent dehydrogenase (short-subunit alcohol dehydrogenase family)